MQITEELCISYATLVENRIPTIWKHLIITRSHIWRPYVCEGQDTLFTDVLCHRNQPRLSVMQRGFIHAPQWIPAGSLLPKAVHLQVSPATQKSSKRIPALLKQLVVMRGSPLTPCFILSWPRGLLGAPQKPLQKSFHQPERFDVHYDMNSLALTLWDITWLQVRVNL